MPNAKKTTTVCAFNNNKVNIISSSFIVAVQSSVDKTVIATLVVSDIDAAPIPAATGSIE